MANPIKAGYHELIAVLIRRMATLRAAQLDDDLEPDVRQVVQEAVEVTEQ